MPSIAPVIPTPCHAVIFVSTRSSGDDGYGEAAERMHQLGTHQPGFLGITSVRDAAGHGITVVFYDSAEAARNWGRHPEHREVIKAARDRGWYEEYVIYHAEITGVRDWARSSGEVSASR